MPSAAASTPWLLLGFPMAIDFGIIEQYALIDVCSEDSTNTASSWQWNTNNSYAIRQTPRHYLCTVYATM